MQGRNADILVFGATNMPWNVDPAFRRPGRFDRVLFVPPPDRAARLAILQHHMERVPGGSKLDLTAVAEETKLLTGADLKALCERASEGPLERSLQDDRLHEVDAADLARARKATQSTALEWIETARNHARYANQGGRFDELVKYLKRIRRW